MASKPYLKMLDDWIHKGVINDPYNEFMIVEDKEIAKDNFKLDLNDKFWEKKYTLKRETTPKFLESFATKILLIGKYINAVNTTMKLNLQKENNNLKLINEKERLQSLQKHQKIIIPNTKELLFSIKEDNYRDVIDNAYDYANKLLLDLLLQEFKLIQRLKFVVIFRSLNKNKKFFN